MDATEELISLKIREQFKWFQQLPYATALAERNALDAMEAEADTWARGFKKNFDSVTKAWTDFEKVLEDLTVSFEIKVRSSNDPEVLELFGCETGVRFPSILERSRALAREMRAYSAVLQNLNRVRAEVFDRDEWDTPVRPVG